MWSRCAEVLLNIPRDGRTGRISLHAARSVRVRRDPEKRPLPLHLPVVIFLLDAPLLDGPFFFSMGFPSFRWTDFFGPVRGVHAPEGVRL